MADRLLEFDDFTLWGDDADPGLFRDLIARAEGRQPVREPAFEWIIRHEVGKLSGPLLLDLGANIGYYAQVMAQEASGDWKLICIEPDERNYRYLAMNTEAIVSRCERRRLALGNVNGTVHWQSSDHSNCGRVNSEGTYSFRDGQEMPTVVCNTLTKFLERSAFRLPDFIKMDIEGGELNVFRGARKLLQDAETPSRILVEVHQGEWRDNPAAFRSELECLILAGWTLRYVVSAHTSIPKRLSGWEPWRTIVVPRKTRAIYRFPDFPLDEALHYLSVRYEDEPAKRVLRAMMLEKT